MFDLKTALNDIPLGSAGKCQEFQVAPFLDELNQMRGQQQIGLFLRGANNDSLNNDLRRTAPTASFGVFTQKMHKPFRTCTPVIL